MSKLLFAILTIILLSAAIPASVAQEADPLKGVTQLLSPLKQFVMGINANEVVCKEGLELLLKKSDGSPLCVKPQTKEKLIERGWASENTIYESKPESATMRLVLMNFIKQDMQNPFYFYKISNLKDMPGLYEIYKFGYLDVTEQQYQIIYGSFHDMCLRRPDANPITCGSLDMAFEYDSKKYWIAETNN